ncbi:MAG: GAF domain-containing protein [Verrucomicrobiae bacterium]|nr:GAF domain-containing protein [Verrucomicrobiae bacterium]
MADDELRRDYERLRLLYQVSQTIHSTLEPQPALELILREAVRLMRATSGSVVLINPNTGFLEIQASHGLPPTAERLRLKVGEGITGWVARTGRAACVGDVLRDRRYVMVRPNTRSELAVHLEVQDELRGVINVDSDRTNAFSEADQTLLEELAIQAARVIHNTWLYEQLRLQAGLFETLLKIGQTINSTLVLDEALRAITREACGLMEAKMCALLLVDATGQWLDLQACYGAGEAYLNKPRLNIGESLVGAVVRRRKPLQVENVQVSSRYQSVDVARAEGLVSLLSVPLRFAQQIIGTLSVYTGTQHNFSNEEIRILTALADLSGIAIEKARLYERIVTLEEQLRQNEKLSALGLLAAEVAHEIRNPLTVMKLLFQSLELDFPGGDPRQRDVAIITDKMDHLNRIVEQILDFARHSEPRLEPVGVNQLVDDLALLIRHKLAQQNVRLDCRPAPDPPPVLADATQLEQAFLNLTLNALEAMPQGGCLTITTRALRVPRDRPHPTHVAVSFRDTGQGLTPEQRRRVFAGLLNSSKARGTGLGLMIVDRVVRAHGGRTRITSKPGQGTRITIVLPV